MSAAHAIVLAVGFLIVSTIVIRWMIRANASERRSIERRRQAWVDRGSIPDEEPNFFSGSGGGSSA